MLALFVELLALWMASLCIILGVYGRVPYLILRLVAAKSRIQSFYIGKWIIIERFPVVFLPICAINRKGSGLKPTAIAL